MRCKSTLILLGPALLASLTLSQVTGAGVALAETPASKTSSAALPAVGQRCEDLKAAMNHAAAMLDHLGEGGLTSDEVAYSDQWGAAYIIALMAYNRECKGYNPYHPGHHFEKDPPKLKAPTATRVN